MARDDGSTIINGKRWTPTLLVAGIMEASLRQSTLNLSRVAPLLEGKEKGGVEGTKRQGDHKKGRKWKGRAAEGRKRDVKEGGYTRMKKSCLRSFIIFLATLGHPFANSKVPYRFICEYFIEELDTRPLVRQAARNKLTSILQALIIKDLLLGDAMYAPAMSVMRSLILAATRNSPPSKAPLLTTENPLEDVPEHCKQLVLIWLVTGVRYDGLFRLPKKFTITNQEPVKWACLQIRSKTATLARPRVFCVCFLQGYMQYCPICRREELGAKDTYEIAQDILRSLKCQKHTFRRVLATAFVLGSNFVANSPISDLYVAWISQVFGWNNNNRSMLTYYTSDAKDFNFEMLPEIVRVTKENRHSPPSLTGTLEQKRG